MKKNDKECIIHGCINKKSQGNFVGDLCVPCYEMITTGKVKYGDTFIHHMYADLIALQPLIALAEKITLKYK